MKILITGALGFLGGQLVAHLRQQTDWQLRLLVRRVPPELADWVQGLDLWKGDLTQPETLRGLGDGITGVVHLAALDSGTCKADPVAAQRVNTEGTLHLLRALEGAALQQFVYVSTFHVYGANKRDRVTESTPVAPVHPYATSHAMAELLVGEYARQRRQGATILRLANSCGPPLYPGAHCWQLVVNDLCRQAVEQQKLVLRSSGLPVRNFVALPDVVRALTWLLARDTGEVEVLNLGGDRSTRILDVAQAVQTVYQEQFGGALPLERPDPRPGETTPQLDYRSDAIRALGFVPQVSLTETLRATLAYCQQQFG